MKRLERDAPSGSKVSGSSLRLNGCGVANTGVQSSGDSSEGNEEVTATASGEQRRWLCADARKGKASPQDPQSFVIKVSFGKGGMYSPPLSLNPSYWALFGAASGFVLYDSG